MVRSRVGDPRPLAYAIQRLRKWSDCAAVISMFGKEDIHLELGELEKMAYILVNVSHLGNDKAGFKKKMKELEDTIIRKEDLRDDEDQANKRLMRKRAREVQPNSKLQFRKEFDWLRKECREAEESSDEETEEEKTEQQSAENPEEVSKAGNKRTRKVAAKQ